MADNYRQTILVIPNLDEAEEKWLHKHLCGLGFQYSFEGGPHCADWKRHLWIYGEEFVHAESVADLLQAFLAKHRPDGSLSFSYADTCSKPRADRFSGGAVFVTAKRAAFMHTDSWLMEQTDKFEAARTIKVRKAK